MLWRLRDVGKSSEIFTGKRLRDTWCSVTRVSNVPRVGITSNLTLSKVPKMNNELIIYKPDIGKVITVG